MRYVALLRGINVGGNTMIKMAELKSVFERLGFANVVTYINSGNIAFDHSNPRDSNLMSVSSPHLSKGLRNNEDLLATRIEQAIEKDFSKTVPVMVRERQEISRVVANNPFEGEFESHKEMHVLFLKDEMPKDKRDQLLVAAREKERFAVKGREIYCHLPMGVADSLLGTSFVEKKLKVAVTGRNWRTVEKLTEL